LISRTTSVGFSTAPAVSTRSSCPEPRRSTAASAEAARIDLFRGPIFLPFLDRQLQRGAEHAAHRLDVLGGVGAKLRPFCRMALRRAAAVQAEQPDQVLAAGCLVGGVGVFRSVRQRLRQAGGGGLRHDVDDVVLGE
jgi:hypothetical protein